MLEKPRGKRKSKFAGATAEGAAKVVPLVPLNDNQKLYIDVPIIEFQVDDIVRSDICRDWVVAFESENL